ncbi:MAG: ATP-grasp fold amidoligase family protein [Anaerolineales bacterium]
MKIRSLLINIMDTLPIAPRDFSWKMRWRMRHDRNPLFIELLDKYKVKAYADMLGIRTAETFFVTDQPETIPFDSLPETYFLKANHGCRWNILHKDQAFYLYGDGKNFSDPDSISKYKLTRDEVIRHCRSWLASRHSRKQWAYQHIPPLILAEDVLVQRGGGELNDYKFYTFHGKVELIKVFSQTIRRDHEEILLDANWQPIKLANHKENDPPLIPAKPETLQEMLDSVGKLSNDLDFVRVDLYDTAHGVVLGEMTIYPLAGRYNSPTPDPKFNKWLGDQWMLPRRLSNP